MRKHHVRMDRILLSVVSVHPHETSALLHSSSCFFFILSAYFVVLPLRDEGALISNLPGLFVGSLVLTLVAAPVSTLIFSSPTRSKARGLELMHRFFGVSLIVFFILWHFSTPGFMPIRFKGSAIATSTLGHNADIDHTGANSSYSSGWDGHSWFYVSVRIGLFLRVTREYRVDIIRLFIQSGSRLFGFIGAGATLGQLFGSLFAAGMAWMGSIAALLMELAAQSSKGINRVHYSVWKGMHRCYCSKTWRCYCCRNVRLLFGSLKGKTSTLSLYALPVCFLWMVVAFYLGKRREQLTNFPALVLSPDSQSNDIPASASQPSDS